jgi:hypothetical protein
MSAVLDTHTRYIRNIQIVRKDLLPLIAETSKEKRVPSTTINAFGATIQESFEKSNLGSDFCIFSSWLAVLSSGKVSESEKKSIGTIHDHVMQAVNIFQKCPHLRRNI